MNEDIKIQNETDVWKFFTISIAILSLGFSWYTYHKLLPLSQANVIFSESDIKVTPNIQENAEKFDVIEPHLKNIGKAKATNIKLQIYALPFNKNIVWTNGKKVEQYFNAKLIHNLEPDASSTFGHIKIFHYVYGPKNEQKDLSQDQESIALIFCLEYKDSIKNTIEKRTFLYHHTIGTPGIFSLISDDYDKIKDRLLKALQEQENNLCDNSVL